MSEILFYHLTQSHLENTLPDLIVKSLKRKWKVGILCRNEQSLDSLNDLLWTFSNTAFIPHGRDTDDFAQNQPVILTLQDQNINQARVVFCLEGRMTNYPEQYKRVCLMFDNENEAYKNEARETWKKLKAQQKENSLHELTYWQQTPQRKWEKKA